MFGPKTAPRGPHIEDLAGGIDGPSSRPARPFRVIDSGKRTEFATGAVRDDGGDKPRPDLIPPLALLRIGRWYAMGAAKYGERNWEKGIPKARCLAAALRHLLKWAAGARDEDHLAAVCFNVMAIIHYEETGRTDLDDEKSA